DGRGHQPGERGRGGEQPHEPLLVPRQPRAEQQPDDRGPEQEQLRQQRRRVLVRAVHRATSSTSTRDAGSITSSRNRGSTPITVASPSSGTTAPASLGRRAATRPAAAG